MASAQKGPVVAYGGSYGLGVLTSETILTQDTLHLETDLNPRAVIYVRVRTAAIGEVDVYCTHLTPDDGTFAPGNGRTWHDVHAGQVQALTNWIGGKSDGNTPTILMGDLNCGPSLGTTISGRFADDYQKVLAVGFLNNYVMAHGAICTFCDANPLNEGFGTEGTLIDHILTKAFDGHTRVEPILREPVGIFDGSEPRRVAYSDHYGLKATFSRASH